jgi:hypothetical protein
MREAPRSPLEAPIGSTLYQPNAVYTKVPKASGRTLCTIYVGVAGVDGHSRDGLRRNTAVLEHGTAGSLDRRGRGTFGAALGTGLTRRLSIRRGLGDMFGGISSTDSDAGDIMLACASSSPASTTIGPASILNRGPLCRIYRRMAMWTWRRKWWPPLSATMKNVVLSCSLGLS